jgi:hypothetical protein
MVAATFAEIERDPLFEQARMLPTAAHALAIQSSTDPRAGGASCLKGIGDDDSKWWDFFVVVGVMFYALHTLRLIGRPRCDHLEQVAVTEFERMFPRGREGFMDCAAFFDRSIESVATSAAPTQRQFSVTDTIGGWIVWNILDRPPASADERQMVRTIGILISKPFEDWWSERGD